jgi:hypothetical protein
MPIKSSNTAAPVRGKAAAKLHPALVDKLPGKPGPTADLLYQTREARYAVNKVVEALEKQEADCRDWLIANLKKGEAGGATGYMAYAEVYTEPTPQVEDWDKFYAYIARTKAWELLTRALGKAAIKERWDNKKEIPGVVAFNAVKVSITKKKR